MDVDDEIACATPETKRSRNQRNEHFCLVCNRMISRGNFASRKRHADGWHRGDPNYDCTVYIVKNGTQKENAHLVKNYPISRAKRKRPSHSSAAAPVPKLLTQTTVNIFVNSPDSKISSAQNEVKSEVKDDEKRCPSEVYEKEMLEVAEAELVSLQFSLKKAACFHDLHGLIFAYFSGPGGQGLMRCNLCFEKACEENPELKNQDPFAAHHIMGKRKPPVKNPFLGGVLIDKAKLEKLIEGKNTVWYCFKNIMKGHVNKVSDFGGHQHFQAQLWKAKQSSSISPEATTIATHMSCALVAVKQTGDETLYKNLLEFLHTCGANSEACREKYEMLQLMQGLHQYMVAKIKQLLTTVSPSTGLPPHFATCSVLPLSNSIDQAPVLVTVMFHGRRTVFPLCTTVPAENWGLEKAVGFFSAQLSKRVVDALCNDVGLPTNFLSHLTAHYVNNQCKASKFENVLHAYIEKNGDIEQSSANHRETFFITPQNATYWIDSCISAVREKEGSTFFQRFLQRADKFDYVLFSQRKRDSLSDIFSFQSSTDFFAVNFYERCKAMCANFAELPRCLENFNGVKEGCEDFEQLIQARDFCFDLCGILDYLLPVVNLIKNAQSPEHFLWSITKWCPKLQLTLTEMNQNIDEQLAANMKLVLNPQLFPKLSEHFKNLCAEDAAACSFQGVSLTQGQLITKTEELPTRSDSPEIQTCGKQELVYWKTREVRCCLTELRAVGEEMLNQIRKRFRSAVPVAANILGKCLCLPDVVKLMTGNANEVTPKQTSLELYGTESFAVFYAYVCSLPHVADLAKAAPKLNLSPDCCRDVLQSFKSAVFKVIWNDLGGCRKEWFTVVEGSFIDAELTKFEMVDEGADLRSMYKFTFGSHVCCARLTESSAFASFYTNVAVYTEAGQEYCIALDVALAMCGAPAEVESYCSVLKAHASALNDSPENALLKANVDWHFPNPPGCKDAINAAASLFFDKMPTGSAREQPAAAVEANDVKTQEEAVQTKARYIFVNGGKN